MIKIISHYPNTISKTGQINGQSSIVSAVGKIIILVFINAANILKEL